MGNTSKAKELILSLNVDKPFLVTPESKQWPWLLKSQHLRGIIQFSWMTEKKNVLQMSGNLDSKMSSHSAVWLASFLSVRELKGISLKSDILSSVWVLITMKGEGTFHQSVNDLVNEHLKLKLHGWGEMLRQTLDLRGLNWNSYP